MSKKIAQLTKVIYHLNTKNEDHATMLETLDLQHKLEIEQLTKDAQSRMASQKEMADMKQKMMIQAAQMEKLNKKHTAEKQKTLAEVEKLKENMQNREVQLISDWQLKTDQLNEDVEKVVKAFAEKVAAFDNIRSSNEKYQDMLVQQLQEQEKLKGEYEARLEELQLQMEGFGRDRLEKELGQLRARMAAESQEALMKLKHQNLQNANIECGKLRQQVSNLQTDVADAQEVISNHIREHAEKDSTIVHKDSKIEKLSQEIRGLQLELQETLSSGEAALADSRTECDELEKSKLSLEADVVSALNRQIDDLRAENNSLKARLDDALKTGASESETLMIQLMDLRKQLAAAQQELSSQRERLAKEHANNDLGAEMDKMKAEHAKDLEKRRNEAEEVLEEQRKASKAETDKLKLLLAQMENQLANLTDNAENAKQTLEKEYAKAKEKVKNLKLELDAKRKEGEGAQGVISGLKSQIESLREELKASQKAFRDKMDMGLARLEEDWQRKMDTLVENHGQALLDQREDIEAAMNVERQALVRTHEETVSSLQEDAKEAADKAASLYTISENERLKLQFDLKSEIDERAIQVASLNAKWEEELRQAKEEAQARLDELGRQLLSDADAASDALRSGHATEIERLKKEAAAAAEAAKQAQAVALQHAAAEAEKVKSTELLQQKNSLNEGFRTSALEMTAKYEAEAVSKTKEHEKATLHLNNELSSTMSALQALKEAHAALGTELNDEKARASKESLQAKMAMERLAHENQTNLRNEKEASQKALMNAQDSFQADMRLLKVEFAEDRSIYERSLEDAKREYLALEEKYQNRESRPDDLARIQQLEYEMVEKDELVKTTRDEMLYLKRELMNREESYNSKFNAKPVVGVMNVLKDPAANKGKSGAPGMSSKTNKPTNVVRPQPGMGMGMMGGIGGSGVGNSAPPGIPGASKGPVDLPSGSREGRRR
eukprot:GSChrysophyteH1.ASY1.ANO1.2191.1 assembled CDS